MSSTWNKAEGTMALMRGEGKRWRATELTGGVTHSNSAHTLRGPCGCGVELGRRGRWLGLGPVSWPVPAPTSLSPVQTEVREPVLDDDHHVADSEEEGGNLE